VKRRVIIESPYAGDVDANLIYARECLRDSLKRGEAPLASHALYTQEGVLNDDDPDERKLGIEAGFARRHDRGDQRLKRDRGSRRDSINSPGSDSSGVASTGAAETDRARPAMGGAHERERQWQKMK
jgi:hypothetical protein